MECRGREVGRDGDIKWIIRLGYIQTMSHWNLRLHDNIYHDVTSNERNATSTNNRFGWVQTAKTCFETTTTRIKGISQILFIVVLHVSILLRRHYTCIVCSLTPWLGGNLFRMNACMRVPSTSISRDSGRRMRYRLHLVTFMTYYASLSISISTTRQRPPRPGALF